MRNYQVTVTYDLVAESEDRARQFVQWHLRQSQALVRKKLDDVSADDYLTGIRTPYWVYPEVSHVRWNSSADQADQLAEHDARIGGA